MTVPTARMSCHNGGRFLRPPIDSIPRRVSHISNSAFWTMLQPMAGTVVASYFDARLVKVRNDVLLHMCTSFNKGHRESAIEIEEARGPSSFSEHEDKPEKGKLRCGG